MNIRNKTSNELFRANFYKKVLLCDFVLFLQHIFENSTFSYKNLTK